VSEGSIAGLVILAITLSWDNFRSAVALGTVPFGVRRAVQIALIFGFWDALAPLVGGLLGRYAGAAIGPVADYVGPAVMGAYGLYLLVGAVRHPKADSLDHPWVTLFGLPLALSVDNLIAGTGLGLLGFSPVAPAVVLGAVTAVMSFAGLWLGRLAVRAIPVRADLLSAVSLLGAAVVLPLVFHGP
jgi:putative Mn2+ efflux pump MntP